MVKDDSGSHAVFSEQGSSASQMKWMSLQDYQIVQYQLTLK